MEVAKVKYSFSKLNSFDNCKFEWERKYVHLDRGMSNAFSEHGTIIHNILENYANGETKLGADMVDEFLIRFDQEVVSPYPIFSAKINLREHYKQKFALFLAKFKGFSGKTVATEHFFDSFYKELDCDYRGYIDLITETEESVNIIDFKSGNKYTKKDMINKQRQLLLYYPEVRRMFPDKEIKLFFYFLKEGIVYEVKYNDELLEEAYSFVKDTKKEIEACTEFDYALTKETEKKMSFFCGNICSARSKCKAKDEILTTKFNYESFGSLDSSNLSSKNKSLSNR